MTKQTTKILMYVGGFIITLSSTLVAATGLALMSVHQMSWQEQSMFWLNTPLLSGVLSTAIIVALSVLALPPLACVWLFNELTSRSVRKHAVTPAPFLPYRVHISSVGPLNPSGRVARGGFVKKVGFSSLDPQGNKIELE